MALLKRDDGAANDLKALLGAGTIFEGKLSFEGAVRIDGKFNGSITNGDMLIVGEGATIVAEITCESIVVCGEVTGDIRARNSVELRPQAKVRGDIETPSLIVERGALFEGHMEMAKAAVAPGTSANFDMATASAGTSAPPPLVAVAS